MYRNYSKNSTNQFWKIEILVEINFLRKTAMCRSELFIFDKFGGTAIHPLFHVGLGYIGQCGTMDENDKKIIPYVCWMQMWGSVAVVRGVVSVCVLFIPA